MATLDMATVVNIGSTTEFILTAVTPALSLNSAEQLQVTRLVQHSDIAHTLSVYQWMVWEVSESDRFQKWCHPHYYYI